MVLLLLHDDNRPTTEMFDWRVGEDEGFVDGFTFSPAFFMQIEKGKGLSAKSLLKLGLVVGNMRLFSVILDICCNKGFENN